MRRYTRFRNTFLAGGSLLVTLALIYTDPDKNWVSTKMLLLSLITPLIAVLFVHLARKALFDYPESDMGRLFEEAKKSPVGAGLALIALAIVIFGLLGLFGQEVRANEVRTFIPEKAKTYMPMVKAEQQKAWSSHPAPYLFGSLIEQESCISLRHSRCWSPTSRLKTQREEGAGLGQITRAYRPDGALRFDSIAEMRRKHPALSELTWENVYNRPDLQIRAMILESKTNWDKFVVMVPEAPRTLAFVDAAYNGGFSGVQKERRACGLSEGCDPQRWFDHVEKHCMKSKKPLYGGRSACDINREHVHSVMLVRSDKYARIWCHV